MSEAGKKLVVDRQGVTITGDHYQFSTSAAPHIWTDPDLEGLVAEATGADEMESVITGLQSMTRLSYGQYCGLSRALELIGERWSMLLVRDLLVGPKSLADLRSGFPRISAETFVTRVKELEHGGVVRRTTVPATGAEVYELTEFGAELDDIALRLGRWGSRLLGDFRPDDVMTPASLVMGLRGGFNAEAAAGRTLGFQLSVEEFGVIVHAMVQDGALLTGPGSLPGGADLVIDPKRHLRAMLSGELNLADAVKDGLISVQGDADLLPDFVQIFGATADSATAER